MADKKIYPVLLAGGIGTRLWPMSTVDQPKQFVKLLNLGSDIRSLFQITLLRYVDQELFEKPLIVTHYSYKEFVEEQIREIGIEEYDILYEVVGKDTGPAIVLATRHILNKDQNATVLLVPADHYIPNADRFRNYLEEATHHVNDNIIIFGITPDRPETGYGYIKEGANISNHTYEVDQFTEKPHAELATEYINDGRYYWNSGIYMFKGEVILEEFRTYQPRMMEIVEGGESEESREESLHGIEQIDPISIDNAITEKSDKVVMVKSDVKWSDVGSWLGLWEVMDKDSHNNYINVNGQDAEVCNCSDCYIMTKSNTYVNNLDRIAIIETDDRLVILNMNNSQQIKNVAKDNHSLTSNPHIIDSDQIMVSTNITTFIIGLNNLFISYEDHELVVY